jgi:hypothetical protein
VRLIFAFERYKKMRKEKKIYFVFFAHTKKKCFQQIEKAKNGENDNSTKPTYEMKTKFDKI